MSWPSLEIFYSQSVPGCRAVLMLVHELQLTDSKVVLTKMDMYQKLEHKKPWFVNMNPQQTLPTIKDEEFILWESHAILQYLVNKYGANRRDLYPTDVEERATVDSRMYFDIGTLYKSLNDYFHPQLMNGKEPDSMKGNALKQALDHLDIFLQHHRYVAGDNLTIADFSILASVTHLEGLDYRIASYGHLKKWVDRLKMELPYYEECNKAGIDAFRTWAKNQKKFANLS